MFQTAPDRPGQNKTGKGKKMTDQLKSDMIKEILEKALWLTEKMNSSIVRMRNEPNWGDYNDYNEKISDLRRQADMIEKMTAF